MVLTTESVEGIYSYIKTKILPNDQCLIQKEKQTSESFPAYSGGPRYKKKKPACPGHICLKELDDESWNGAKRRPDEVGIPTQQEN